MWPEHRLPEVVLETVDLEMLNDRLFSKMWFNYNEHSRIDEASLGANKRKVFLHTVRCCEERIINVFHELCRENIIVYVTRGEYFYLVIDFEMYTYTLHTAYVL